MKTFFQELKKRRVYRVAFAYAVAGSALVQLAGSVFPVFHAPDWPQQVFVILVALGFPVALMMAWVFEMKDGAIKRTRSVRGVRPGGNSRRPWILGAVGLLVAFAAVVAYWWWPPWRIEAGMKHVTSPPPPSSGTAAFSPILEKSIAVLPFENLSDEKQNAYFADGMQDEILTDLSKVADLKVISRTSVMQYKARNDRNLREIATALSIAYVLEGSVQRANGRIRVSTQLIDARTDAHVWAEHYDRELKDVFAVQSEVAEAVVSQLKVKLSLQEKAAINEWPTRDLAAYDLYVRGKALVAATTFNSRGVEELLEGVALLEQAVQRDPLFFLAYYQLARAHDQIYLWGGDHTPARLALAETAVKMTLKLRPDAGESHAALAEYLYWGHRDYERARAEVALAKRGLPNDPLPLLLEAYMDRRQGRWNESTIELQHALAVDPHNINMLQQIAITYQKLRRYPDMVEALDRALALAPNDVAMRVQRAFVDLEWRADPKRLHATIETIVTQDPTAAQSFADLWVFLALCERDHIAADRAMAAMTADGCYAEGVPFPRAWCAGVVARAGGDAAAARTAFEEARNEARKTDREQPDYAEGYCVLGLIDAGLNRKEDAIREGRRAIELLPITRDAIDGALLVGYLSQIYAWTGEKDLAIEQLKMATQVPGGVSYGELRLHPNWDSLRGDSRFETIVASLAPTPPAH